MPNFAAGVVQFQKDVFPQKKELFEQLSKGQAPDVLFITCADSRITPSLITQTEPGDLLVCRNAGNIVPTYSSPTGGMSATVEFAAAAVKVDHIVICGHSDCGAMKGAMNIDGLDEMPHLQEWLGHAIPALNQVDAENTGLDDKTRLEALMRQNVILQLENLKTHPSVATRLAKGDIELHGWIYDIGSGGIQAYDEATQQFTPVEDYYAEVLARQAMEDAHHHD